MKRKTIRYRNRHLAIKGNPQFGLRVEKAKKGKGSYERLKINKKDVHPDSESTAA